MSQLSEKPETLPINYLDNPAVNGNGMVAAVGPDGKISYTAFLEWADEDTHAEWVDGEIEMSSPASYQHQDIKGFLESVMRSFVEANDLGQILSAGFQMKLPGKKGSGREPDVMFIAKANLGLLQKTYLDGPADLAIEIISPESQERDRVEKFKEYAIGGVLEYWLIDQERQEAQFFQLDVNNQYQTITPDSEGKYFSQSLPGFWLQMNWLWMSPKPQIDNVLYDIDPEGHARRQIEQLQNRGFLPNP